MRYLLFLGIAIILSSCASNKTTLSIPANQSVEVDYPNYDAFNAKLKNRSLKSLDVSVVSKKDNEQIKGFGLEMMGKADVLVEAENKLVIQNKSDSNISIRLSTEPAKRSTIKLRNKYVSFTLRNTSDKSIPLIIPTVMNPNLSPNSNSGVDLKIGQEIFFRSNRKKYVLLVVDSSINEGDIIDIPVLLKERKKQLGIN